jgi:GTPase SAR1 family protein
MGDRRGCLTARAALGHYAAVVTSATSHRDARRPFDDARSIAVLRRFLDRVAQRYAASQTEGAVGPAGAPEALVSLALAGAVLRDLGAADQASGRPRQIAVLGPTQVGKSTVVNLLLGQRVAEVSPLAGFTIHPQGFAVDGKDEGWLAPFFPGWQRCAAADLSPEHLDRYSITTLTPGTGDAGVPSDTVVWDTPDFDSLAAASYRGAVLEVVALADALVLVLSKEKYSDLAVWHTLALIEPLGRPLMVCLNKMTEEADTPVVTSLRARLVERWPRHRDVEVVVLPLRPGLDGLAEGGLPPAVGRLRDAVRRLPMQRDARERQAGTVRLLRQHWREWTAPIAAEHAAHGEWRDQVDTAVADALTAYRRDYLDHPQRFDTFRRALVEVLHLLELPGVAGALSRVRHLLTWPARRLFAPGRRRVAREGARRDVAAGEEQVLEGVLDRLLTTLAREAARRCDPSLPAVVFWRAMSGRLADSRQELRDAFVAAVRRHHAAFQPEIEAAGGRVYAALQGRPALLNTLRAMRVTTDAAAIAIAVKTAGLGVGDLLVAPAMLSLTSTLTEGALGAYLAQEARELKARQYAAVEEKVFKTAVAPVLHGLVGRLEGAGLFAIEADDLAAAEQALEALGRG